MKARLYSPAGDLKGASFEIGSSATIGRDAGNDIRLPVDQISKRHARIWFDAERGSFFVEDCGSRNGTELDGVPVAGAERLEELHVISFGGHDFVFQRLATAPAVGAGETTSIEGEIPTLPLSLGEVAADAAAPDQTRVDRQVVVAPAALVGEAAAAAPPASGAVDPGEAARTAESLFLELTRPGEPPSRYALAEGENLLGRSSRAAVSVDTPELSRRHAVLTVKGGRVWIEDQGSRNHSFCAGERVKARVEVPPGAALRFANINGRIVQD